MMIQPVFDPAIPGEVRDALLTRGERLRYGSDPPLVPPGWGRGAGRDAVRALALGAVCAVLPAVLACAGMFGRAGRIAAVATQVVLVAAWLTCWWLTGGLWLAVAVSGAVQLVCTVGAFALMDAWQLRRGVRRARGRYLVNDDFDPQAQVILARAQAAIAAVTGSEVSAAGLLDDAANHVILSRQEWEIAQMLARQAGEKAALVARRVAALERYAELVRDADAALAQRRAEVGAVDPAESVALAEIDDLSENARSVGDAIRAAPGVTGQPSVGSPPPQPGDG